MTEKAVEHFRQLIEEQLARVERMKADAGFVNYAALDKLIIGVCGGDGIGPVISREAARVLEYLLAGEVAAGKVEFRYIDGLTIENRVACGKAIPDDVMEQLKECHVILKGPTTTPQAGGDMPNIESANVAMRKALDLFANVRPVKIPEQGIDWTFFRENTEGSYVLGSKGVNVTDDLAFDFTVTTKQGSTRIARLAYEFARANGKPRVSLIQKANVIKTTDGNFLRDCHAVAAEYPEIITDEWYIDITTAKLLDEKRRRDFSVFVLPNLYGDIVTDVAAEHQGGLGTAASSNIGNRYALFEAIHGTAPRLIARGCGDYADPCSLIRAMGMMMAHIGYADRKQLLEKALDICTITERKLVVTRRKEDASAEEFTTYLLETVDRLRNEQ